MRLKLYILWEKEHIAALYLVLKFIIIWIFYASYLLFLIIFFLYLSSSVLLYIHIFICLLKTTV